MSILLQTSQPRDPLEKSMIVKIGRFTNQIVNSTSLYNFSEASHIIVNITNPIKK